MVMLLYKLSIINYIFGVCVFYILLLLSGWPKNLETWNLRNFENNLEFSTKIMKKPGISHKNHGKTWNFF